MAEEVDSKESFLRFVQALAEDAEAADAEGHCCIIHKAICAFSGHMVFKC